MPYKDKDKQRRYMQSLRAKYKTEKRRRRGIKQINLHLLTDKKLLKEIDKKGKTYCYGLMKLLARKGILRSKQSIWWRMDKLKKLGYIKFIGIGSKHKRRKYFSATKKSKLVILHSKKKKIAKKVFKFPTIRK